MKGKVVVEHKRGGRVHEIRVTKIGSVSTAGGVREGFSVRKEPFYHIHVAGEMLNVYIAPRGGVFNPSAVVGVDIPHASHFKTSFKKVELPNHDVYIGPVTRTRSRVRVAAGGGIEVGESGEHPLHITLKEIVGPEHAKKLAIEVMERFS
ncbi:MAG: hypothetical protein JW834_01390 [Candidatus Diapherotrites archaeon]|nr:hypothetical protein [Candidatus Diapherotrites archaeon]